MQALWLALYFPALPLEVFDRGQATAAPLAVSAPEQGRERISRCNPAAGARGIQPAQPLADALALCAGLRILARDPQREGQALADLAAWAYQFSSHIAFDPLSLLLEIGASRRLFGGLPGLLDRLQEELPQLGFETRLACARTPAAASLLARYYPGRCQEDPAPIKDRLRRIPLAGLTRDRKARELIQGIGLRTLGDCLDLPRPELARRIGPELIRIFDRLMGEAPDPRPLWRPPAVFRQRLDLLAELQQSQALIFPARRLIVALCGFLRGHGGAAQRLEWRLAHRDRPPSRFEQGLLAPSRDPEHLLDLLRERIERVELPAPVGEIELQVADWRPMAEAQADLFGQDQGAGRLDLLERLRSRLGEQTVCGLATVPDHRPERAMRESPPQLTAGAAAPSPIARAPRPVWLLRRPRPLDECNGQPEYGGPLCLGAYPERIEGGWWDGDGRDQGRDYYIAENPAGERLWIYRDLRHGGWFLHGLFG